MTGSLSVGDSLAEWTEFVSVSAKGTRSGRINASRVPSFRLHSSASRHYSIEIIHTYHAQHDMPNPVRRFSNHSSAQDRWESARHWSQRRITHSWAYSSSSAKQNTQWMFSSSSLKLRLRSVKSWTPAQILVTGVRIAGRAGETCHGTLLVRSISAVTKGLIDCTGSELVERGTGGSCLSP